MGYAIHFLISNALYQEIDGPSQLFASTRSTFDGLPLELTGTGTGKRYNINAVPSIASSHQYRIGGDIGSYRILQILCRL